MADRRFIRLATPEEAAAFWGQPIPSGYVAEVAAEDERWRLRPEGSPRVMCRGTRGCPSAPVAELRRPGARMRWAWWAYCAEHMYGRWIEDGRVVGCRLARVEPDGTEGERDG